MKVQLPEMALSSMVVKVSCMYAKAVIGLADDGAKANHSATARLCFVAYM